MDTLWIDSMANVRQEFYKMREKNALFGMSLETTALNGNGSWYKGGRHTTGCFHRMKLIRAYCMWQKRSNLPKTACC